MQYFSLEEMLSLMAHWNVHTHCMYRGCIAFSLFTIRPNNITSPTIMYNKMIILLKTYKWLSLHWKWFISHNIRITISFIVILYASLIVRRKQCDATNIYYMKNLRFMCLSILSSQPSLSTAECLVACWDQSNFHHVFAHLPARKHQIAGLLLWQ